jgi:uncharacterized protein
LDVIDALRGFAMMGICLLHFVEHFDMGGRPAFPAAWLMAFDSACNETVFFVFSGKAYSLFALLFGMSFFILMDNAAKRGEDFRLRFVWRLCLLCMIGYVHSLLFVGDFLTVIALLGFPVVFLWRLPNRILWPLAIGLLLIVPHLFEVLRLFLHPNMVPAPFSPGRLYKYVSPSFLYGDFGDVLKANLWMGHKAKWCWTIENGRYLQMLGLFVLGVLLGRSRLFENPAKLARVAWCLLLVSLVLLVPLYYLKFKAPGLVTDRQAQKVMLNFFGMQTNLVQMLGGSALLVLLFRTRQGSRLIGLLIPYGRMSLSCYVTQALIGVPLFYSFGLGMYRHMGAFYSLAAGVLFFACHLCLAHLWLRHFHQGPLEWLWRCATERDFSRPFRRRADASAPLEVPQPVPSAPASR